MQFYFPAADIYYTIPFGKIIRGLRHDNERPTICYISPKELEKQAQKMPLAMYLLQIRMALTVGGRIEIKSV